MHGFIFFLVGNIGPFPSMKTPSLSTVNVFQNTAKAAAAGDVSSSVSSFGSGSVVPLPCFSATGVATGMYSANGVAADHLLRIETILWAVTLRLVIKTRLVRTFN
jgi:hypothetical protein